MGVLVLLLVLCDLGGLALDEHNGDNNYAREVNSAGSVFAFLNNPLITIADSTDSASQGEETLGLDTTVPDAESTPPASTLVNRTEEGGAVPIGDQNYLSPASGSPLLITGTPLPTVVPQTPGRAANLSDRNRDLIINNQQLKQDNEALWQEFDRTLGQVTSAKDSERRQRDRSEAGVVDLEEQNQELRLRNEALREQLQELQGNVSSTASVLSSGTLEEMQSQLSDLRNQSRASAAQLEIDQTELENLMTILNNSQQNLGSVSAQEYLSDKNARVVDSGLTFRISEPPSTISQSSQTQSGPTGSTAIIGMVRINLDTDSNDDNGDDLEASLDMVYVVALGFVFLLLQTLRVWLGYRLDTYMSEPLHNLFVDVSLMVALAVITAMVNHMDWLDHDKIDLGKILFGFSLFILFWLLLGVWLVLAAQAMSRKWFLYESKCGDILTLSQHYQEVYLQYTGQAEPRVSRSIFSEERLTVQYAVMRQLFICPIYLPFYSEQLLGSDFNLAEYLSRCLAAALTRTFQLSFIGVLSVLGAAGAWRSIVYGDFIVETSFYMAAPMLLLLLCLILLAKLRDIYHDLVPYVYDPEGFSLPVNPNGSLANPGRVAQPNYLQGSLAELESSQEAKVTFLCFEFRPLQLSCAYIFSGRLPSRHELLFWFDAFGPQFVLGLVQALCVILCFWSTIILDYYIGSLYDEWELWGIIAIVGAFILWLFMGCFLIPEILRWLTLASRIEQMKDREIIEAVVLKTRADRSLTMVKLYRQVKLVYREMNRGAVRGDMYPLPDYMQEFVQEVFRLTCEPGSDILPLDRVEDALDLCGVKLSLDELRVFIWESDAVRFHIG